MMALHYHNAKSLFFAVLFSIWSSVSHSQQSDAPHIGVWKLSTDKGYSGFLALDGIGGCSYFLTNAVISIQATCLLRSVENGELLVFGTREGTVSNAHVFSQELASKGIGSLDAGPVAITFHIVSVSENNMIGNLITNSGIERVLFNRN